MVRLFFVLGMLSFFAYPIHAHSITINKFSQHQVYDSATDKNVKTVVKYFECLFKTHDFTTLATLIAPGAIYHQAEGLPYGGTFTGFADWTKMFIKASGLFDLQIETEPLYFCNNMNDGVIIRFTIRCTAKRSGNTIVMPIAEHFELKDGKITSIRPFYFDTQKFSEFLK